MQEMGVECVVELGQLEFAQCLQDDWGWRPDVLMKSKRHRSSNR
jgi:hypothetical protein